MGQSKKRQSINEDSNEARKKQCRLSIAKKTELNNEDDNDDDLLDNDDEISDGELDEYLRTPEEIAALKPRFDQIMRDAEQAKEEAASKKKSKTVSRKE